MYESHDKMGESFQSADDANYAEAEETGIDPVPRALWIERRFGTAASTAASIVRD
jgi:hypothetical protein